MLTEWEKTYRPFFASRDLPQPQVSELGVVEDPGRRGAQEAG